MLRNVTNSHTARLLFPTVVLVFSTCLMAAEPCLTPEGAREQRIEKVRRRAETYWAFKRAQDLYYDGMWLQARGLFLQIQRERADLGFLREQSVKSYLRLINLNVDRLCRPSDRRCGRAR